MSSPFIGEIKIVGFNFPPRGWATCAGQLLAISSNTALFSLLGTTFGGDGRTTFALPDLRGRVALGQGTGPGLSNRAWGQRGGEERNTLATANMPSHTHTATATPTATATAKCHATGGDGNSPVGKYWSKDLGAQSGTYHADEDATMAADAVAVTVTTTVANQATGGGQSHNNIQPYLTLYFVIALQGLFPSRN